MTQWAKQRLGSIVGIKGQVRRTLLFSCSRVQDLWFSDMAFDGVQGLGFGIFLPLVHRHGLVFLCVCCVFFFSSHSYIMGGHVTGRREEELRLGGVESVTPCSAGRGIRRGVWRQLSGS
jgi:hypothetical protein